MFLNWADFPQHIPDNVALFDWFCCSHVTNRCRLLYSRADHVIILEQGVQSSTVDGLYSLCNNKSWSCSIWKNKLFNTWKFSGESRQNKQKFWTLARVSYCCSSFPDWNSYGHNIAYEHLPQIIWFAVTIFLQISSTIGLAFPEYQDPTICQRCSEPEKLLS
jgi:hypothetical protein